MPTPTYDLIASTVLTTNSASVTITPIPSYRDLVLVINAKILAGTGQNQIRINSDTGTNYSNVSVEGNGSSPRSDFSSPNSYIYINVNNGDMYTGFSTTLVHFIDANQSKHKTVLSKGGSLGTNSGIGFTASRWNNTSAISTLLIEGSATYATGSSFTLFGVVA